MPFLFSLGQHSALEAVQQDLFDCEFFFRSLWMIHVLPPLHRVGDVYNSVDENLWVSARNGIHGGKTNVWNATIDQSSATRWRSLWSNPKARVRRRSHLPFEKQGIKILGTPLGHPQFGEAHFNRKNCGA